MTYESPTAHRRTQAEMDDQALSWARPDRSFFAAGACHILAWTFLEARPGSGFRACGLRRVGEPHPFHVIAQDGATAFDFAGWTPREELLAAVAEAIDAERPGTNIEELELPADLGPFCALHHHRRPDQFAGDVRARARTYLRQLDPDARRPGEDRTVRPPNAAVAAVNPASGRPGAPPGGPARARRPPPRS